MAFFSPAGMLWLYSGVTTTNASEAARAEVTASSRARAGAGRSSTGPRTDGSAQSTRSITCTENSGRQRARPVNHSATTGPKRPCLVLPTRIVRWNHVRDRRRNVTTITAKGRKLLQRLDTAAAAAQDALLAPLSQAERRQFTEMLQRLVEHHMGWRRSPGEQARPEAPRSARATGG
jgi:hypothetical protein